MDTIYVLFAGVLAVLLFLKGAEVLAHNASRKKAREQRREALDSGLRELARLQAAVWDEYGRQRRRALEMEDWEAARRLDSFADEADRIVRKFNKALAEARWFEEAAAEIDGLWARLSAVRERVGRCGAGIRDLRGLHRGAETEREAAKHAAPAPPFARSRYFRGCDGKAGLAKKYRELARLLHPDNGGSAAEFAKMGEEYAACLKEAEATEKGRGKKAARAGAGS